MKEFNFDTDMLPLAKKLGEWQAHDTDDVFQVEKSTDDIRHDRQERREYDYYRKSQK